MLNNWSQKTVDKLEKIWSKHEHPSTAKFFSLAGSYGNSFLDIGCGSGRFFDFLSNKRLPKNQSFSYIGLDSSIAMIHTAKTRYPGMSDNFIVHDISKPFAYCAEVIVCHEVLIHMLPKNQIKVLSNMDKCHAKIIVLSIQTSNKPTEIEHLRLGRHKFINIVQNLDEFNSSILENISNVSSIDVKNYYLVHDVYKSILTIKRDLS